MPKFETVRRVPVSAEAMYDIVADVERYPDFLPMCEALTIVERSRDGAKDVIQADMTVAHLKLKERFRSLVMLDKQAKTIEPQSIQGPFKHLENNWHFEPLSETSCDVAFKIDYAFKSWALEKLMGGMFEKAFATYAASFEARAIALQDK